MKKLCCLLFFFCATQAQAHYVWLEREGDGPARIYFGEWERDVREKAGGHLDRIATPLAFQAGKTLKIVRRADHIEVAAQGAGDVTATEAGLAPREDKNAGGKTKTIFYAKVGRNATQESLTLELVPTAASGNEFRLLLRGKPLAKTALTLFGPPKWEKSLRTDEQGVVRVTTPWIGTYIVEVAHIEQTAGESSGEKYDRLRHVHTLSFDVAEGLPWSTTRP